MLSKEITTSFDISTEIFISNLKRKVHSSKEDSLGLEYFQWRNIQLKGDKIIIEKVMKPLNRDAGGKIESYILPGMDKTILKSKITVDTFFQDIIKYIVGIGIGFSGILYLALLDFNYFILIGLIFFELIVFVITPLKQKETLNNLVEYYNQIVNAIATE